MLEDDHLYNTTEILMDNKTIADTLYDWMYNNKGN